MPPKGKHHSAKVKALLSKKAKKHWRRLKKIAEKDQLLLAYEEVPISHPPTPSLPEEPGNTAITATLFERGSRYGDFADNARISQDLKGVCESEASWNKLNDLHREGLTMILQKIARIINGDPNYKDNWHDIQGYAKLVEDRLP